MISLTCSTQQYDWGKEGNESVVGQLVKKSEDINLIGRYAELWMGTHPSGPSKVKESKELLSIYLKDKDHLIGTVPSGYPNNDLPFLFKGIYRFIIIICYIIIIIISAINQYCFIYTSSS